ncbi:hypothetical protein SLA2020_472410 [Shorea laevis]
MGTNPSLRIQGQLLKFYVYRWFNMLIHLFGSEHCDYRQCKELREVRWIKWYPLHDGIFKLNSNGSLSYTSRMASGDGLVRKIQKVGVHGFLVNIGRATSFITELWGLKEGL